jgi:AcrR family transcriptional regulator
VTRNVILSAAESIIAERGIQTARMEDIAAAAGVSVGTIYNHFVDREALVHALLDARRQDFTRIARQAMEATKGQPFETRLATYYRTMIAQFEAHRPLFALFVQHEVGQLQSGEGLPASPFREIIDTAAALVNAGVKSGELDPEGSEVYPVLLLGMMRGLIAAALVRGVRVLAPVVPTLTRVFLRGAAAAPVRKKRRR